MDSRPKFRDRWQYFIDELFSRGPAAMIAALAVVSLAIILVAALVLVGAGIAPGDGEPLDFFEAFWLSLMRTLDAGTMGGDAGWGFRLVQFIVTIGGIFVISALIGVLSNGISERLEGLRKGRSRIIEQNHTVILGWSEQVFTIVAELVEANRSLPGACIAILGGAEKPAMEDELRQKVADFGKTRVVVRSGDPMEMTDLALVSLETARSIIIPSPQSDDPDSEVIKTILAITNHPGRRPEPYHIVAEIRDPKNFEIARVIGKGEVECVQVGEFIARIIAQTCRQSGLSVVYTELLNFGGDEIYFYPTQGLGRKTFGEALLAFENNTVLGLCSGGKVSLGPDMNAMLQPDDQLILIAPDEDKIQANPGAFQASIDPAAIVHKDLPALEPERTLLLGWNWRGPTILRELDGYVAPGSRVTVVADLPGGRDGIEVDDIHRLLTNQSFEFIPGDTTDRRVLESLQLDQSEHIVILAYSDTLNPQQADARTLITLLHLRDIAEKRRLAFSIVTEMLDIRNRNLAEVAHSDDFIVSDKLVSLMLAQVSENKLLNAVFADLFNPEGSEIYLKPVKNYVEVGRPVSFYTVVEAARQRGETAIGYRLRRYAQDSQKAYGVITNPSKSAQVTFEERDRIIVLAEQ